MCYVAPLVGAITTSLICRTNKSKYVWWLNLMLYGGGLFGVIDHLWNGELFSLPKNLINDILLGLVILGAILLVWLVIIGFNYYKNKLVAIRAN